MCVKKLTELFDGFRFDRSKALQQVIGGVLIVISFVYLGSVLLRNWSELEAYEWRINVKAIAISFVVYSTALFFAALGWSNIINNMAVGVRGIKILKHLKYYTYAHLLQRSPIPLLYVLGRSHFYEGEGICRSVIVTASVLEWVMLILSGIVVYLCVLPFTSSLLPDFLSSLWIMIVFLGLGALFLYPPMLRLILKLLGKESEVTSLGYVSLLKGMLIYGMVWCGGGVMLYIISQNLYTSPFHNIPTAVGIWTLSGLFTTVLFALVPGFGAKEVTLSILLGYFMPSPLAVVVAILTRFFQIFFDITWGVLLSFLLRR